MSDSKLDNDFPGLQPFAQGSKIPSEQPLVPESKWVTPAKGQKYERWFLEASQQHGLPPGMLSRVAYQESRYNPTAVSPAGAQGLMQIIPRWHPGIDPYDPREAIFYAASYLRKNYNRFGDWAHALAAYNWGPTALAKHGIDRAPKETRDYYPAVLRDIGLA